MKGAYQAATRARLATLALALGAISAAAQNTPAGSAFSFAVFGDSRSMMYLPYKATEEAEARKLMTDMFELVLPEQGRQMSTRSRVIRKVRASEPNESKRGQEPHNDGNPKNLTPEVAVDLTPAASILTPRTWTRFRRRDPSIMVGSDSVGRRGTGYPSSGTPPQARPQRLLQS